MRYNATTDRDVTIFLKTKSSNKLMHILQNLDSKSNHIVKLIKMIINK